LRKTTGPLKDMGRRPEPLCGQRSTLYAGNTCSKSTNPLLGKLVTLNFQHHVKFTKSLPGGSAILDFQLRYKLTRPLLGSFLTSSFQQQHKITESLLGKLTTVNFWQRHELIEPLQGKFLTSNFWQQHKSPLGRIATLDSRQQHKTHKFSWEFFQF
jgi:hypothetical protein